MYKLIVNIYHSSQPLKLQSSARNRDKFLFHLFIINQWWFYVGARGAQALPNLAQSRPRNFFWVIGHSSSATG